TPDATASGCTPDVDGPTYRGYERFFTEQLTGKDVVTGKELTTPPKATVKEAHYAAALNDSTKDIPLSTSEYYLINWSDLFEEEGFKPRSNVSQYKIKNLYYNLLNEDLDKIGVS